MGPTILPDRAGETLLGLVQHYSPSGAEAPAVAYLVERMQALGYTRAFTDATGNAVGVLGEGPRQIVLLGHIDTVPGEIPVKVTGDRLDGRGAVDAKGPLAAFVDAAAQAGAASGWQIVVIGAIDEERDSIGARGAILGYHPEFAIIGEPSGWERVTLGYKGSAWAELTLRHRQAHSAGQGESACEAAFALWGRIREWASKYNEGHQRVFDQALPTLRGFDSGEDGFEAWASLRVGARLPLDCGPEEWYAALAELSAGAELRRTSFPMPAYQAEKNTPLVRGFLAGIRAAGGQPGFVLKSGTADLNLAAPAWGCPAVAYGPGDSALDHTPEEHISLAEYARSVEVLAGVLERLCQSSSQT